jgi:hypothetical protein
MRKPGWVVAVMAGCAVGLGVAGCSSSGSHTIVDTRVRSYTNYRACLLTGAQGIYGAAAPAWAGMQSASLATHAQVSYLAVGGPGTKGNALAYVGTEVVQQCDLIIADGAAEQAAVLASSGRFKSTRFAIVAVTAGPLAGATSNVTVIAGNAAEVKSGVAALVRNDACTS